MNCFTAFRQTPRLRSIAVRRVHQITSDPQIIVRAQSNQSFQAGFALYQARPDKEYSLTDCISMETMRQEGITDILTHDNHFTQEGFTILLYLPRMMRSTLPSLSTTTTTKLPGAAG